MAMATGNRWTRDELLIALNLYHKLRFEQFDQRQPVIIEVAERLGRTSGSVAMKLSNLASLDPALKLRGIRGLEGASQLDRNVWDEFHAAPAEFIPLSQERFDGLFVDAENETTEAIPGTGIRLLLSTRLRSFLPDEAVKQSFEAHQGQALQLPDDASPPDAGFLAEHRKRFSIIKGR